MPPLGWKTIPILSLVVNDSTRIYDGFTDLSGGQDDGRAPNLLEPTKCESAENLVFRGGLPTTRPGFQLRSLNFTNPGMAYAADGTFLNEDTHADESMINFYSGKFQCAGYYATKGYPEMLMVTIGGRLYKLIPDARMGAEVTEIKLERRNNKNFSIGFMQQADRFHITQDGDSRALIFDGLQARRAKVDEVPTGTIMAYGMGRLVVIRDRNIYFGDLYGSHDGTDPGDSVIQFTESTFLQEGYPAAISFALGKPTGAKFSPQQDSAVGDGELLVFSEGGVTSFFLSQPREVWKESAFQRITLLNIGGRGHRAIVSINGDVWFRSNEGWRSYRQARAQIQGWARLPMSTEVSRYVRADSQEELLYGSAITFDNRLIGTCTPQPNKRRVYHQGILALDFDVLSSFGLTTKPAWDGHWSGHKVTQLIEGSFRGIQRAFAFVIDEDGRNQIYEITKNATRDTNGSIPCSLTMRSYDFQSPFNQKELYGADIWFADVKEPITPVLSYRPDQHPQFQAWHTLTTINPQGGDCQDLTCGGCPTVQPAIAPRKRVPKPTDACDSLTGRIFRLGYEFQPKLEWTGHARISRFRLQSQTITEDNKATC